MLMIAICDDDSIFAQRFQRRLKLAYEENGIKCRIDVFDLADDLLMALDTNFYDIICLDIEIGKDSGIDIGNSIRDKQKNLKSQIVFVSSFSSCHHAGKLYDSVPMAFIEKPFDDNDIKNIIEKTKARILVNQSEQKDEDYFTFEFGRKKVSVLKSEIIYIEGDLRSKVIHTVNKNHTFNSSMKQVINMLDDPDFILVHRSFLVNMHYIETISSSEVLFKTGDRVDVSATHYKNALWAVTQFWKREKRGDEQHV